MEPNNEHRIEDLVGTKVNIMVGSNQTKRTSTESKGSQTEDQQRHLVQDHRRGNEYGAEPKQANIEPNVETIDLHPTNTETLQSYHVSDSPDVNRVPLKRSTVGKFVTEPFVFLFFLLCAWNTRLVFRENFCYAVKM